MILALTVAVVVVLGLLVCVLRLRADLSVTQRLVPTLDRDIDLLKRELSRLESEKGVLSGFLGVLPALAHELRFATTERQVVATLVDTLVSTLEPREAVILMRRRRSATDGSGSLRFVVAAATPGSPVARLGQEVPLPLGGRDPRSFTAEMLGPAGLALAAPIVAAPMVLEAEIVGLIALSAPGASSHVPMVVQALADMGAVALHQVAARRRYKATADLDELTNVFNKRHITQVLSEEQHKAQESGNPLAVILFDVDHFKHYNDVHGHLAGDILLRLLAQFVHDHLRTTDTVGRFGGEEFLVVLPGTSLQEAATAAEKLRALVAEHEFPGRDTQPDGMLSVSGGIAAFPAHGPGTLAFLRAADQALYVAKRAGRNRVVSAASPVTARPGREAEALEEEWGE
jgi:diguanylate cyclase (GGDEF)-like protein